MERGNVPDVEKEDEGKAANEVVGRQRSSPADGVTDPARADRPDHVHRAHHAKRCRGLDGGEAVLERVRHEVSEDHPHRGVAADEVRRHQEPELRDTGRVAHRDAAGALECGDLGGRAQWTRRAIRPEPALLGIAPNERRADRQHQHQQNHSQPEEARTPTQGEHEHRRERDDHELAR